MLSVSQFATAASISVARARQLAAGGQVRAEKVGSQWAIADAEVVRWRASLSRPMAERIAWAAAVMADGGRAEWLESSERSRLRKRLNALSEADDAVGQVQAWMRARGAVGWWRADEESLVAIAQRVRVSGVASAQARMSSGGFVEGYVQPSEVKSLVDDFWLVPAERGYGELVLRVSEFARGPVPRLIVAADLADHGRSREAGAAERVVREVVEEGLW
ncbi:hypothetical protein [Aeromicrobium alkaliterrae]|uniref:Helix-turn-helix domain-containing protein n=1 Tax=Aeromicrobium alkaliterrae TaxID=302168 RepID=A0ABN2K8T3_9ACTN